MSLRKDSMFRTSNLLRSKLDCAIFASLLAMGGLNLLVMSDQLGAPKAYAATPCEKVQLA
ncbi:hypothetical protein B2G71_01945 [Novosphingobium sp. PC22D]|uniref:hypothetical protein n=1 Tax=Novosphingobium sp. PC22D TaxID=1962403 RepID=UPI000BF13C8F|nr:hypothetical protein [Novosphingobium sp. PC22D]PEQ14384.1 hypothetical protein B2G71_01945 [Novosphingobium sp. PC22D]